MNTPTHTPPRRTRPGTFRVAMVRTLAPATVGGAANGQPIPYVTYQAPARVFGMDISRASGALCAGDTHSVPEGSPAPVLLCERRESDRVPFLVVRAIA